MAFLLAHIPYFIALIVLLLISAFFAGSETVLFSLSRHDRLRMKQSGNRLQAMAAQLMENPRALLTTLMIGNMLANVIIFVLSTIILKDVEQAYGKGVVAALAVTPALMVTYFSDVLPKVFGALNNTRVAPLVALPLTTFVRLSWPVYQVIDRLVMRPAHLLIGERRHSPALAPGELRELLEMSEEQGVIDVSENELLQEVVRIADVHVKDVMTPRVDMICFDVQDPPDQLFELFRQTHLTKLPVYDGRIENLLGLVYAKEALLTAPEKQAKLDIRKLLRPVQYTPEFQTLDRLIARFRATKTQLAMVVDEFGGIVGVVTLEDVVEQMVGDIYELHDTPVLTTQKIGPEEFRVAGDLSIVDWLEAFGEPGGVQMDQPRVTTVAGLLALRLRRIPKIGDQVTIGHLLMTVESMRGRRVDRVRVKVLIAPDTAPSPAGGTA
jgi:putative hemolysin